MWANPTTPNLADYIAFVQVVMAIDPLYLPSVIPPAAPTLAPETGGGSLQTGTVYVIITYVSALGETTASLEASVAVTGPTGQVVVTSPPSVTGATGYNVYAAGVSGTETLQNGSPVAIGTPYDLNTLEVGTAVPVTNTASSPFIGYAFDQAMALVLQAPPGGIGYTLAVYNCAGHVQIRITPDETGRTFFQTQRETYGLLKQSNGLVQSTSNVDTSSSLAVSDALKQLTLTDLAMMKTPWGREALAYQQDYGSLWGLS